MSNSKRVSYDAYFFTFSPAPNDLTTHAQAEARTAELAEAHAAATASVNGNLDDGFGGEAAETSSSSDVRRLRLELDKKGSELDTAMKEREGVIAELKEMKDMLGAAANAAGAAGADEDSLRKRVSQLMCENGLLKGERDRQQALEADAKVEARSNTSRFAAEVGRLEREVERLAGDAGKASEVAADGDRAKAALSAMEAKLSEARQERAELQVCADAACCLCLKQQAACCCCCCCVVRWQLFCIFCQALEMARVRNNQCRAVCMNVCMCRGV